jgi:hypothetical protein
MFKGLRVSRRKEYGKQVEIHGSVGQVGEG